MPLLVQQHSQTGAPPEKMLARCPAPALALMLLRVNLLLPLWPLLLPRPLLLLLPALLPLLLLLRPLGSPDLQLERARHAAHLLQPVQLLLLLLEQPH
jgi:hypothetical protein